jgi:hypothetical protein
MDIGSAFTFMFDDEAWVKKLAIGGGIIISGLIFSPILIGLALLLVINGYMLQTLKNVRDGKPIPLPEWRDFGDLFSKGLMVLVIWFVYHLPALIFLCLSSATNPIMVSQWGIGSETTDTLSYIYFCSLCLEFTLFFLGSVIFPAALIRYAQYDTVGSAFHFREIFSFISNNTGDYIIVILLKMVAGLIASFGFMLCFVGIFFAGFWSTLVGANLYGQLAKEKG